MKSFKFVWFTKEFDYTKSKSKATKSYCLLNKYMKSIRIVLFTKEFDYANSKPKATYCLHILFLLGL